VVLVDQVLRRGQRVSGFLYDRKHNPLAGFLAMFIGMAISIPLFANQPPRYTGWVPTNHPGFGDITFEVGFVIAAAVYWAIFAFEKSRRPVVEEVLVIPT
jgi:cytosine/uracil/thiamine/allantoin permease